MKVTDVIVSPTEAVTGLSRWLSGALIAVTAVGLLAAVFAIGWETHFDCGGTFGGFGESASARLDDDCVASRWWRLPAAAVVIGASSIGAWLGLRRVSTTRAIRWHEAFATIVLLAGFWTLGLFLFAVL